MKNICIFASALLMLAGCKKEEKQKVLRNGQEITIDAPVNEMPKMPERPTPPADGKYPAMTFEKTEHDFGTINQGDKATYAFAFKNTGEADLVIADAKGSCGCTVPAYPKDPVKPGESGEIKVVFNSAGKTGIQHKTVTLTTNTAVGNEKLAITASIKTP
jgi:hypothetical protein